MQFSSINKSMQLKYLMINFHLSLLLLFFVRFFLFIDQIIRKMCVFVSQEFKNCVLKGEILISFLHLSINLSHSAHLSSLSTFISHHHSHSLSLPTLLFISLLSLTLSFLSSYIIFVQCVGITNQVQYKIVCLLHRLSNTMEYKKNILFFLICESIAHYCF